MHCTCFQASKQAQPPFLLRFFSVSLNGTQKTYKILGCLSEGPEIKALVKWCMLVDDS